MKKGTLALAVAAFALAGCANKVWYKHGASQQEFYRDRAECSAMSGPGNYQINTPQQTGYGNFNTGFQQGWNVGTALSASNNQARIFSDCMVGRGWVLQEETQAKKRTATSTPTRNPGSYVSESPKLASNLLVPNPDQFNPDNPYEGQQQAPAQANADIGRAVEMLMDDPFKSLTPEERFWRDLGRQIPDFREINSDKRFHYWLSVTDSTTGKQRQQLLIEAQQRHDADTVAAMFRQFLKTL